MAKRRYLLCVHTANDERRLGSRVGRPTAARPARARRRPESPEVPRVDPSRHAGRAAAGLAADRLRSGRGVTRKQDARVARPAAHAAARGRAAHPGAPERLPAPPTSRPRRHRKPAGPRPAAAAPEGEAALSPPESWLDPSRAAVRTELFGSQSGLGPFSVQSLIVLASAARAQQAVGQFERLRPCRPVDGDGTRRTVARRAPGEYTVTASAPEMPTLTISLSVRAVGNVLYLGGDMGLGPASGLTEQDARANRVVVELPRRASRPAPTATASAR